MVKIKVEINMEGQKVVVEVNMKGEKKREKKEKHIFGQRNSYVNKNMVHN